MGLLAVACSVASVSLASDALAAQLPVGLGAADSFAVLSGTTVTNVGFSTLTGDLGVSPGTALTGFPPGIVNGTVHATDPVAAQAQADLTTAYNDAAGRTPPNALPADAGGSTLAPGVYKADPALGLTGTLTLDGQGDPNAVFIFQVGSALTTAVGSRVNLINGAQPSNVFWQIGSSATLGTSSVFAGTILALSSISTNDGVTLNGRALARNGAVTLINDTITAAHSKPIPVAQNHLACTTPGQPVNFPTLWLGTSFEGLAVADVARICTPPNPSEPDALRENLLSVIYGDCTAIDDVGCQAPLEVQSWPACERNLTSYAAPSPDLADDASAPSFTRTTIAGLPAAAFDDGTRIELYTGAATVVVFGTDPAQVSRAAQAVRPYGQAQPPAAALPQPVPGALTGTLPCASSPATP